VLPERPLFSREKVEPSASIVLKVRGTLEAQQVRAIRHLIASAVNGLRPERVSIVDEGGQLLADGASGDATSSIGVAGMDRQQTFERRLREQIESIVTSVVGPGRARVQLTADFDLNRITQTSDTFDPEGRVLRSSQVREETSTSGDKEGQVTVANELPGANQRGGEAAASRDQSKKSEEIVNYEISRTTKTEVIEGGRVKRISAAVLVDGTYGKNEKGESTYQPRSKEDVDRIAALVRTAIGFDQKRGDQVEIVNLRFAEAPVAVFNEPGGWSSMFQFGNLEIMRGVELAVMALLAVFVVLFVVRPLVGRIITPDTTARLPAPAAVAVALPAVAASSPIASEPLPPIESQTVKMIDIAQVRGQVHAQSVQKVGELADGNPNETVAIIRHWLHDAA
jgi:flagellar M-ring protein FliF